MAAWAVSGNGLLRWKESGSAALEEEVRRRSLGEPSYVEEGENSAPVRGYGLAYAFLLPRFAVLARGALPEPTW